MPRSEASAIGRRSLELKRGLALRRIDECLSAGLEAKIDQSRVSLFLSRYSKLESFCTSFESHHLKLCSELIDPADLEKEDDIRAQFDQKYFKIIEIHSLLTSKVESHPLSESHSFDTSVKLPRLNLMHFDGDIKSWGTFYDMFHTMVHQNKRLSNIERFSILISLLRGEPLQLLKGFPLSENNYLDAYAALIDRYQCKRKLAFHHWEELQNFKCKSSSPRELRRLVDTFKENIAVLKNLKLPVIDWDFPLFYLLINKLDQDTRRRFELQNDKGDIPSFSSLLEFLDKASQALELAETDHHNNTVSRNVRAASAINRNRVASSSRCQISHERANTHALVTNQKTSVNLKCILCNADHLLVVCPKYTSKLPNDRFALAKEHRLCVNCLRPGHVIKTCLSKSRCHKCGMMHHTSLHFETKPATNNSSSIPVHSPGATKDESIVESNIKCPSVTLIADPLSAHSSLLATAFVNVLDNFGNYHKIRVVVDSGSQSNFITMKCARRIGLPLRKTNISVEGIGQTSAFISSSTKYSLIVSNQSSHIEVHALAVPKICGQIPTHSIDISQWPQLYNIKLADPKFNIPGPIDALIGVDIFCKILLSDRIECGSDGPTAINTKLGWIVMGNVLNSQSISHTSLFCSLESLNYQLRKFWEVDELPVSTTISQEDALCERIFVNTHTRTPSGRYIVRLPFKALQPTFGDSYSLAYRRFLSLEKRFSRLVGLRDEYNAFMKDYIDAGHMELVEASDETNNCLVYYIPHHSVLKPSSTTTRLRVVFDATAKPSDGPSLNDQLLVGPKLQTDLGSIILRFRLHAFVFTADVKQMYRQILVSEQDRDFQRILFRFRSDEPIRKYRLNTVTYGMASSSFLALRTLRQVVTDEGRDFPLASRVLSNDIFVDDIVTGADSIEKAQELQRQVTHILSKGCFALRKWNSNSSLLLENIPVEHRNTQSLSFNEEGSHSNKVLGLEWNSLRDTFSLSSNLQQLTCTKRNVLSELARIFDPLGFLTPLTFAFKCIIQKLWVAALGWDDLAPDSVGQEWSRYRVALASLSSLHLNRFIPVLKATRVELHGFCDASELGYAAAIYFRLEHPDSSITTHLIISRSKVASLKRVSIPRLELCAAVLLSDLVEYVKHVFSNTIIFDYIFCWSDSMVTLAWLRSPSSRWKTYVGNRVGHIQERVSPSNWHHVRSEDNPTDCASRGLTANELINHSLWWSGPEWLSKHIKYWPCPLNSVPEPSVVVSEQRNTCISLFVVKDQLNSFLEKYSSLRKIQGIIAYVLRFIHNCKNPKNRRDSHLIASELNDAMLCLVKITQSFAFSDEINRIKRGLPLPKTIRKLQPFIDEKGLIRVGGRLVHSDLDYDCKHPLLLPRQHRLTELIIDQTHNIHLHPGLRTLSYLLAQNYWILSSRRAINSRLSKCIKCYRVNPKVLQPRMGHLPKLRVSQVKPFCCVGVDFAGPFPTHICRYRGSRTFKTYICLFICFAIKAVHIELVSSLSTEAFIGALRRFVARRGRCQRIHCDRGTNFVGAYNSLFPLMQHAAASEAIEFSFNPPAASHFGGLWEINIRSFKTHLARTVGNQILTYEEFLTLIAQIEALLNSRPLSGCEMGSDPNDMSVLTPGHFLTLEPLTAVPDTECVRDLSISNRWQLIQKLHRDFWRRWHLEYLHTLNQRAKWHTNVDEPKIGSLVLIKDEQLKPLNWLLGRIVKLHPGQDGISRVATIQTQTGQLQRPLVKLCPLPFDC